MWIQPREHVLILDAGHGEYMPDIEREDLWEPLENYELLPEDAEKKMREVVPAEVEIYDPTWCTVIKIAGRTDELVDAFMSLLVQVGEPPSGDDDTFDYWPSGVRLLLQMADDLDAICGVTERRPWRTRAETVIFDVLQAKSEFSDELRGKIPGLQP